jgi:hypothetical protein
MKRIGALILALAVLCAPAVLAGQTPKAVVELYTSQGCASCPPADARLTELSRNPDFVALTLHVDLWNYLGWKDTLAKPAFSERQRAYAEARGDRGVYTPQMIFNGVMACVGSDDDKIAASIRSATAERSRLPVPIAVSRSGSDITVEIAGDAAGAGELWLLSVQSSVTVSIERGENKGREATYVNVVRDFQPIGAWSGGHARFEARAGDAGDNFVILLHEPSNHGPGRIIGAAKGPGL